MRALEEEVRLLREEDVTSRRIARPSSRRRRRGFSRRDHESREAATEKRVARGLGAFGRRSQAGDDYRRDLAAVREVDAALSLQQVTPRLLG